MRFVGRKGIFQGGKCEIALDDITLRYRNL